MKIQVRLGNLLRDINIQRIGPSEFEIRIGNDREVIDAREVAPNTYSIIINGRSFEMSAGSADGELIVRFGGREFHVSICDPRAWRRRRSSVFAGGGQQQITAPMPGKIVRILVSAGDQVEANQGLLVVEAMKMQNEIRSSTSGKVAGIFVHEGEAVAAGEPLLSIE
jgi:biotin carboxyl carrier protein